MQFDARLGHAPSEVTADESADCHFYAYFTVDGVKDTGNDFYSDMGAGTRLLRKYSEIQADTGLNMDTFVVNLDTNGLGTGDMVGIAIEYNCTTDDALNSRTFVDNVRVYSQEIVFADLIAPSIVSWTPDTTVANAGTIEVIFSKPVTNADDTANYSVTHGGAGTVDISGISYFALTNTATLTMALSDIDASTFTIDVTNGGTPITDGTHTLTSGTSNTYTLDPTIWSARRKLTFDNTAQASSLPNVPVLVALTDPANIDYSQTQGAGKDLRFTDSDGTTLLDYEIDLWDDSGTSYIWVKVPQIDASSGTDFIYMYYNNAGASDAQNASGVWSNGYINVNHMNPALNDSSGNGINGTNNGTTDIVGKINRARHYNGSTDISYASTGLTNTGGSILAWARITVSTAGVKFLFAHANGGNSRFYLTATDASKVVELGVGTSVVPSGDNLIQDQWHMVNMSWDGSNYYGYMDGVPAPTPSFAYTYDTGFNTYYSTGSLGGAQFWIG